MWQIKKMIFFYKNGIQTKKFTGKNRK